MFKKLFWLSLSVLFFIPVQSFAGSEDLHRQFSQDYNLFVHQGNVDRILSKGLTLQVLLNYFNQVSPALAYQGNPRISLDTLYKSQKMFSQLVEACRYELVDCNQAFDPYATVSQKELLVWFFRLKQKDSSDFRGPDSTQNYRMAWMAARRLNLLPEGQKEATYDFLSELLYRNTLSQNSFNLPYVEGMVADFKDITPDHFHNLRQIDRILSRLYHQSFLLQRGDMLLPEEVQYLEKLKAYQQIYNDLRDDLVKLPYALRIKNDYAPSVAQAVLDYRLQDVLAEYYYDYSKNPAYRQHNLLTGLAKMNGRLVMSDEEVSMWDVLADKKLTDFRYGWVIVNGNDEAWQWGGGICGAATGIFNPAWRSGLMITQRNPHSVFYKGLYGIEDIGLDATVYRPKPDLRFKNTFRDPVVFSVQNNEQDKVVTVRILGNSPYRRVKVEGPFMKSKKEVEWVRQMEYFDGTKEREVLASRYNAIR